MALYSHEMQKAITGRAGDWLARHASPHVTMVVAFAVSAWIANKCSAIIAGIGGMALRFSVNFLAAYGAFLVCLGVWLWTKPTLDRSALLEGAPEDIETKDPWDEEADELRKQVVEHANRAVQDATRRNGPQALVGLALFAMIIGLVFVAGHMVWYARWHLGNMLVLGGKVRHRTLGAPPTAAWLVIPFSQTVWAATVLLVHYVLVGLLLQWMFPQAMTIEDVVRLARR